MRNSKRIIAITIVLAMSIISFTACISSEPCSNCGNKPTKGYKNTSTNETEYYCSDCSSDCAFCSHKATRHYTSVDGKIIFICNDCYEYIQKINRRND